MSIKLQYGIRDAPHKVHTVNIDIAIVGNQMDWTFEDGEVNYSIEVNMQDSFSSAVQLLISIGGVWKDFEMHKLSIDNPSK